MRKPIIFAGLSLLIVAGCSSGDKDHVSSAPKHGDTTAVAQGNLNTEGSALADPERGRESSKQSEYVPLPPPKSANFVLNKSEVPAPPSLATPDETSPIVMPPPPPRDPPRNPPTAVTPLLPPPNLADIATETPGVSRNPLRTASAPPLPKKYSSGASSSSMRSLSSNPFRTSLVADPEPDESETFTTRSVFGNAKPAPSPVTQEGPQAATSAPPPPPPPLVTDGNRSFVPAVPNNEPAVPKIEPAPSEPNSPPTSTTGLDLGTSLVPPTAEPTAAQNEEKSGDSAEKSVSPNVERPDSTLVKVFYATDRKILTAADEAKAARAVWFYPIVAVLLALLAISGLFVMRGPQRVMASAAFAGIASVLLAGYIVNTKFPDIIPVAASTSTNQSVEYGSDRGVLHVGVCEVSIPKIHRTGELESPSIWRLEVSESEERHIVLERIVRHCEADYYKQVKDRVNQSPRKDLFVFIHGYNVTFEDAARRTAQMAYDLRFEGAPIFYSWPSQGELLDYSVDENNVAWTVQHLKKFLLDLAKNSDAKAVNLIAHSMGNRALTAALKELSYEVHSEKAVYNEVILAAPDVDADIFKNDIAPYIAKSANRVTLYASSRDKALAASQLVHGYPRAGDSGDGLVVVSGIDTVDVSEIDTTLLGHSYYSGNEPIMDDIYALLRESRAASMRPWLKSAQQSGGNYWIFGQKRTTASLSLPPK